MNNRNYNLSLIFICSLQFASKVCLYFRGC